jgi:hypothetical protein
MASRHGRPHALPMQSIARLTPDRHIGRLVWGTVAGASLVAAGLGLAFLVIATPLVARSVPGSDAGPGQVTPAILVWALALAVGAALLVAGTSRLAGAVASVRGYRAGLSPVMRVSTSLSDDIVVIAGTVVDGRAPLPEVVVGAFGIAIVHELPGRDRIRQVDQGWEARTRDGWLPSEDPRDLVARDADRVRHWLVNGDLDYVVRTYGALVTLDSNIPRSPACAVIRADQIPEWLAALPRQRSFSPTRRTHLVTRLRATRAVEARRRG